MWSAKPRLISLHVNRALAEPVHTVGEATIDVTYVDRTGATVFTWSARPRLISLHVNRVLAEPVHTVGEATIDVT